MLIEEKEKNVYRINPDDINLLQFNLNSKEFDRACVIIEKQGTIYEKACIDIALNEARAVFLIENPKIINLDFEYIKDSKKLIINLTKETPMNGILRLVKGEKIIFKENVFSTSFTKTTIIDDGRYFIVVDDLDAKRQIVEEVVFGEEANLLNEDINMLDLPCTGKICENGFVCKTTPAQTKDGACCFDECISAVKSTGDFIEIIPLIFWIAIIILITGIFMFRESIIKVKGGKK